MNGILKALVAILLWSTLASISTRLANIPPFLLVALSMGIGSLIFIKDFKNWWSRPKLLIFGLYGVFGYHFCLFMAFKLAPPFEVNLINYTWPILMVLFSGLWLKDFRLGLNHLLGSILAFTGSLLVLRQSGLKFNSHYILGYLLAFGAAIIWSTYSVWSKKVKPFKSSMVGGFCFISSFFAFICHYLLEEKVQIAPYDWFWITLLGFGPMGAAFYFWDLSIKEGDPRLIASLSFLTPLISTVLLSFAIGEVPSLINGIALILIIFGAIVCSRTAK